MALPTLSHSNRPSTSLKKDDREQLRARSIQLLREEIGFISNSEFQVDATSDDSVEEIMSAGCEQTTAPSDLPTHLRGMCEVALLTQEQEVVLFREMNWLKFHANALRSKLNPKRPSRRKLDKIEQLLRRSESIRDHIVKANMRLVISIVKKFVTPRHSFDELLSNGILTLMQTVEKFDFDRGFRFSTYAYRSISRNIYRTLANAHKEQSRYVHDAEDWAFEQEDDRSSSLTDAIWSSLRERTAQYLDRLDKRERLIVRSRFALGAHRKVRTFQYIADKLGISKERVRQLEQRAVGKLHSMAGESTSDELFSAAMV